MTFSSLGEITSNLVIDLSGCFTLVLVMQIEFNYLKRLSLRESCDSACVFVALGPHSPSHTGYFSFQNDLNQLNQRSAVGI